MAQINQLALHSGEDFIELYKVLKVQGMTNAAVKLSILSMQVKSLLMVKLKLVSVKKSSLAIWSVLTV
ncbi:RNA-binding protein S4 [Shewanella putrefaciens]|nr:RNA-binding protein S4 [Shewanella putrefaciens]